MAHPLSVQPLDKAEQIHHGSSSTDSDVDKSLPSVRVADAESELPLAPPDEPRSWWQPRQKQDGDAIATRRSVFDDANIADNYQPRPDWENIHRFNPSERWTFNEEKKVIRKIDFRIMIFTCVMFMALELDRSNIGQAVSDNFLPDLNMDTNDYNLGNTVFRLSFLSAELPSQLVSKYLGPDRWIPMQLCLWSLVSVGQFWLSGKGSFLACRALLGIFQGGFIPDTILYLSYFYTSAELTVRLAFFWTAYNVADIISGFLGAGILQLRGWHGYEGWRWLFLFEGLLTLTVGFFSWFLMPAGPTQTKGILRGEKGWFTEREERIMVNRVIRDDPSKGDMHNRQPITPRLLWASLKDYDLWPIYAIGLTFLIPATPPAQYFTLTLRNLGFDVLVTNLLTIPHTVLSIGGLLLISYLSEKWNDRALLGLAVQLWKLPFIIYLYVVDMSTVNRWVSFAALTLLLGSPTAHPIQSDGIIASNVYRRDDAPRYREGNKNLLAIIAMNITMYILTRMYYIWRNASRDKIWNAMDNDQRKNYLETTKDEGNKRLDFSHPYKQVIMDHLIVSNLVSNGYIPFVALFALVAYMVTVRSQRYRRRAAIEASYANGKRSLSSMTTKEAHDIISQLQLLEFPYAFGKARKIALLKAGGIPTMSKLFAVTGQNTRRNAGKRSVDTEILLRESQSQPRDSDRYATAVARMNYLHARYRRANKITDPDLLHTLGDGLAEIFKVIQREEWRDLTDVEKCAVGLFHKNLGDDMEIPFDVLPSSKQGWSNGLEFAKELEAWTLQYEEQVARPTATNDQYVRVYVDSAFSRMPAFVGRTLRKYLGENLDDVMRESLCIESPGFILLAFIRTFRAIRIAYLRHLALPRTRPVSILDQSPNPSTGLYNFQQKVFQPWYVKPTFWSTWGPGAFLLKALGGKVPGSQGDRFQPQGYDLMTIGPEPQKGKGLEEMATAVGVIKARGVATCPFSQAKALESEA
ncbi:hypothetical protein F66182_3455 [Fusarium sp. NRRL 66182]|nr:hypothetical protein F66182_3455 [Fusarium sp. NRRL 66182]